jgi:hypothetical protein
MKYLLSVLFVVFSTVASAQTIQTFAGNGVPTSSASFNKPCGVTTDRWGNIYLASDIDNIIQKIDTFGVLTRFAGNGSSGYSGDGGPAIDAQLSLDVYCGMATDSMGNVYFSDGSVVRKVDAAGIITTVAGNGSQGYSGDGSPATAAQLYVPTGISFDKAGNLYIIDFMSHNVRKVNTAGIISTIAGSSASHIMLFGGEAIATDNNDNIYITDRFPLSDDRIRKINTAGTITTFAGGGTEISCNGCPATSLALLNANALATDRYGNVYVSDGTTNYIHKITPAGVAYHIAGNNISGGYSGDGGAATAATLNNPTMLCIDPKGDLLFADRENYRFRKVSLSTNDVPISQESQPQFKIYPNPHTGSNFSITVSRSNVAEEGTLSITNTLGQKVYSSTISTNSTKNIHLPLNAGLYFVTLHFASGTASSLMICD